MSTAVLGPSSTPAAPAPTELQSLLPELVALGLHAKQAHWNVVGAAFLPLHALTDELAADTRTWADRVAERAVALGHPVDARPEAVAATSGSFPAGPVRDHDAVDALDALLGKAAGTVRRGLRTVETADAVAHDIYVEVLEGLEKYRWFLRAHAT